MLKFRRTPKILTRKEKIGTSKKSKLLVSERYHYENEKANHRLGENTQSVYKRTCIQNIQKSLKAQ